MPISAIAGTPFAVPANSAGLVQEVVAGPLARIGLKKLGEWAWAAAKEALKWLLGKEFEKIFTGGSKSDVDALKEVTAALKLELEVQRKINDEMRAREDARAFAHTRSLEEATAALKKAELAIKYAQVQQAKAQTPAAKPTVKVVAVQKQDGSLDWRIAPLPEFARDLFNGHNRQ